MMREKRRYRKREGRRQRALTLLTWVVFLQLIGVILDMGSITADRARRRMEVEEGWGATHQVWEKRTEENLWEHESLTMYVSGDSFIFAEKMWYFMRGWFLHPLSVIEARETRPIQAGTIWHNYGDRQVVYVYGYVSDPKVTWEDMEFVIHWQDWQNVSYEYYKMEPADCFWENGQTFFVKEIDITHRTKKNEDGSLQSVGMSGVGLQVRDESGQWIRWPENAHMEEEFQTRLFLGRYDCKDSQ